MTAPRRICLALAALVVLAACGDLPGPESWVRVHGFYPRTTANQATIACRNQSDTAFRGVRSDKAAELYVACMEAFGFDRRQVDETTASSSDP